VGAREDFNEQVVEAVINKFTGEGEEDGCGLRHPQPRRPQRLGGLAH
jgi:hypothetical protein